MSGQGGPAPALEVDDGEVGPELGDAVLSLGRAVALVLGVAVVLALGEALALGLGAGVGSTLGGREGVGGVSVAAGGAGGALGVG